MPGNSILSESEVHQLEIFGHYIFLAGGAYATGVFCFILAVLVLHANPKSKNCRFASFFNFAVAFWGVAYAMVIMPIAPSLELITAKAQTFGIVLLSAILSHHVLVIVKEDRGKKKFLFWNYFTGVSFSILIFSTRLIVEGTAPKLDLPGYIVGGPLYSLIPLYLFTNLFYGIHLLRKGVKRAKGYRRNQLILFLVAILVGFGAGTPGFLLVYDIPVKPVFAPLVCFYPIIVTYAIIKHRFLDITKLAKNTLIFTLLFVALLGLVSVILLILKEWISRWIGMPDPLSQGIAIALAIGLYGPLKSGLSRLTNRILFQHAEHPEIIFRRLSEDMLHCLDTDKLADEVTSRIAGILALDRIGFYMRSQRMPSTFELRSTIGRLRKKDIHQSKQLVQYLERTHDLLLNSHTQRESRSFFKEKHFFALSSPKEIKRRAEMELSAIGGVAAFPVFVKMHLRAVLVMGRKKSDAPWREEEFRILKSFMRHLSLALGNAEYAEAIRHSRERLALSERDASAGALISGVDHEAKNTLYALFLDISSLRANLTDSNAVSIARSKKEEMIKETLGFVRKHVKKINAVIQHLSDLSERKPLSIEENVLPSLIADKALQTLRNDDAPNRIRIYNRIPPFLSLACDRNALYEIFLNLIRNAEQAIADDGEITLEGAAKDSGVILRISDTGSGIAPSALLDIFKPFYTTKRRRKSITEESGSGMGLFIANQYMQGMGGKIKAASEQGKGSVFSLHFENLEPALRKAA